MVNVLPMAIRSKIISHPSSMKTFFTARNKRVNNGRFARSAKVVAVARDPTSAISSRALHGAHIVVHQCTLKTRHRMAQALIFFVVMHDEDWDAASQRVGDILTLRHHSS